MHFNRYGNLVRDDDAPTYRLAFKHVRIIYKNLKAGKPWWAASPMYPISREEAAWILNNFREEEKK